MFAYIYGIVKFINEKEIVLENNSIGYLIKVANPNLFKIEEECLIHIYQYKKEDIDELYGFKNIKEKEAFTLMLNVKGIGPKLALNTLGVPIDELYSAIVNNNKKYLTSIQGIGLKAAEQIILDLKNKLINKEFAKINNDLFDALIDLGFKRDEIIEITKLVDVNLEMSDQLKEALKLLNRN